MSDKSNKGIIIPTFYGGFSKAQKTQGKDPGFHYVEVEYIEKNGNTRFADVERVGAVLPPKK